MIEIGVDIGGTFTDVVCRIPGQPVRVIDLAAFYAAYHLGMTFSPQLSAPFWFPDAVLLCALLCTRRSWWWLLLLATLPIRLLTSVPPDGNLGFLLAVYLNDCGKAVLSAWLLRRYMDDPFRFTSMRDFGVYCSVAVLLSPALSALGGAAARGAIGHDFWPAWEQWFLGNVMAGLIITPILFYWVVRPPNPATFSAWRVIEAVAVAADVRLGEVVLGEALGATAEATWVRPTHVREDRALQTLAEAPDLQRGGHIVLAVRLRIEQVASRETASKLLAHCMTSFLTHRCTAIEGARRNDGTAAYGTGRLTDRRRRRGNCQLAIHDDSPLQRLHAKLRPLGRGKGLETCRLGRAAKRGSDGSLEHCYLLSTWGVLKQQWPLTEHLANWPR